VFGTQKAAAVEDFPDDESADDAEPPITHQQVLQLARAIMDADGESYADAVYSATELLAEVGWSQGKALLDLKTGFDVVPTATLRRLRDSAEGYGSKLRVMDQDTLRAVLDAAFSDGASVPETRDLLKTAFAEGVHFIDDAGNAVRTIPNESWATMVARTELSQAANAGMYDLYDAAGIEKIQWVSSGGESACEDCLSADGQIVNIGEDFDSVECAAPPAHPNCCPAGTRILTDRGLVPIEKIKVGDCVKTHRGRYRKVIGTTSSDASEDLIEIRHGKQTLRATGNHPVYTGARWKPASSFTKGHRVCVASIEHARGVSHVPIETVTLEEEVLRKPFSGTVYNFAVEEDESYIAEGFVVHNCVCTTSPADSDLSSFRGSQEMQDRAARGGRSESEYIRDFGQEHPLDARRAGGAPTGNEDY
jgi:hypothetical protein